MSGLSPEPKRQCSEAPHSESADAKPASVSALLSDIASTLDQRRKSILDRFEDWSAKGTFLNQIALGLSILTCVLQGGEVLASFSLPPISDPFLWCLFISNIVKDHGGRDCLDDTWHTYEFRGDRELAQILATTFDHYNLPHSISNMLSGGLSSNAFLNLLCVKQDLHSLVAKPAFNRKGSASILEVCSFDGKGC